MFEKDCLTLASIWFFELYIVVAACLESCMVNLKKNSSHFKALWHATETT